MEQFHTFSELNRHPLARVVTVRHYALIDSTKVKTWHASKTKWFEINRLPKLAFDHKDIYDKALKTLQKEVTIRPIGFELLPPKFTLTDLQNLYELILARFWTEEFQKRNSGNGYFDKIKGS